MIVEEAPIHKTHNVPLRITQSADKRFVSVRKYLRHDDATVF